jgi:hypothetical protein
MTRFIAIISDPHPLGGVCPACTAVMDESGCRLGQHLVSVDPDLTKGIAHVVEVFCLGTPVGPIMECPACQ